MTIIMYYFYHCLISMFAELSTLLCLANKCLNDYPTSQCRQEVEQLGLDYNPTERQQHLRLPPTLRLYAKDLKQLPEHWSSDTASHGSKTCRSKPGTITSSSSSTSSMYNALFDFKAAVLSIVYIYNDNCWQCIISITVWFPCLQSCRHYYALLINV